MEKKRWLVADGCNWINGARVPEDRIVELTNEEALYDKGLGRITLVEPAKKPTGKSRGSKD
ncbi:hypothetical protein [Roseibium sp.]|uniref:hypothetical protein n=1 Tax=Roseibium sp. TaxID=1936156 RepID=UPI003B51F2FC